MADDADRVRLEELFRRHSAAVTAYVRRRAAPELVDDVVAETFLVAWRRLDDVPAAELPWLLGVARKTLATQRRGSRRRLSLRDKLAAVEPRSQAEEPGDPLGVGAALARLSEPDREAITLVAWEGLTPKEAAAVVGQSPAAFRVRLHRAKRRLRALLGASTADTSVTRELAAQ